MLGVDHDKIILLSTLVLITPILGKHFCCTAVMLFLCYIEKKRCRIVLYCIVFLTLFSIDTWITYPLMEEDPAVDLFGIIPGVGTDRTGSVDDLVACYGGRFCRWKQRECATKRERKTLLLK